MYDLPSEVLNTLSLKTGANDAEQLILEEASESPRDQSPEPAAESVGGSQACSLCSATFPTVLEQKSHLKSDHHHYNLKQKIRGHKPVSEAEFEKLIESKPGSCPKRARSDHH